MIGVYILLVATVVIGFLICILIGQYQTEEKFRKYYEHKLQQDTQRG